MLASSKVAIRHVKMQAEKYFLLDSLLFRIQNYQDEQSPVLYLPESCVDYVLDLYHNSLLGTHYGSIKTF